MAESYRDRVQRESKELCDLAYRTTPKEYQHFIQLISNRKNVGSRDNPDYIYVQTPYMKVDGRVQMAQDEHEKAGSRLSICTEFVELGEKCVCKCTVSSDLKGHATGHAVVNFGGSGVDATSPVENGETSAIGRALGFMGYGLVGAGIASAEEVERAIESQQEESPQTEPSERPANRQESDPKVSPRQRSFIRNLLEERNVHSSDAEELMDHTFQLAGNYGSKYIDDLKASKDKLPAYWLQSYVEMLAYASAIAEEERSAYMEKHFEGKSWPTLTAQDQIQLINWLSVAGSEPTEDDIDDLPF